MSAIGARGDGDARRARVQQPHVGDDADVDLRELARLWKPDSIGGEPQ